MRLTDESMARAAEYLAQIIPAGRHNGVFCLSADAAAFAAEVARLAQLPLVRPDRDDAIPDKAVLVDLEAKTGRTIAKARKRFGRRPAYVWVRRDAAMLVSDLSAAMLVDDAEPLEFPQPRVPV